MNLSLKKLTMSVILGAVGFSASATGYYFVMPMPGAVAKPATGSLAVSLNKSTIPSAIQTAIYAGTGFDFSTLVTVTGDSGFTSTGTTFEVIGTLPDGLSLTTGGVLTGVPTGRTRGTDFTVQATYKTIVDKETYTIVVDGIPLQVSSVSAGLYSSCAVTASAGVKCWGRLDTAADGYSDIVSLVPVTVPGLSSIAMVSSGQSNSCALSTSGGVYCWGANENGQLGDGSQVKSLTPVAVSGLSSGVKTISVGMSHTCALTTSGAVKCWGSNYQGRLGDGTEVDRSVPTAVTGLESGVLGITVGSGSSCALLTGGFVKCWGSNYSGVLGDGSTTNRNTPTFVVGANNSGVLRNILQVSVGSSQACALTASRGVICWGINTSGELGDGTYQSRSYPGQVSGLIDGISKISIGDSHGCALSTAGGLKCWGGNWAGQLGLGTQSDEIPELVPVGVIGLGSGVSNVSTGGAHTCATLITGIAKCWGSNGLGQLGDGTTLESFTPIQVNRDPV